MSSASGRYKSKLFNFLQKQTRRFGEGFGHTFRRLQVNTTWSLEALLYPVYLLIKKSQEIAGKQLSSSFTPNAPDLADHTLSADTPILQVLQIAEKLQTRSQESGRRSQEEGVRNKESGRRSQEEGVRKKESEIRSQEEGVRNKESEIRSQEEGVRNKESGRRSQKQGVSQNESEIRSQKQGVSQNESEIRSQKEIETQGFFSPPHPLTPSPTPPTIVGIASQLSNHSLVLVTAENEILDILTPYQQVILEEKIISEIAKYWQNWRQLGVKNKTRFLPIFKRALVRVRGRKPSNEKMLGAGGTRENVYKKVWNQERSLSRIDAIVAKWETSTIVPMTRTSGEIIRVVRTQVEIFLYGRQDGDQIVASDDLSTQKPKFQALIQAALNYFFGDRHNKKLEQGVSNTQLGGKPFPLKINSQVSTSSLPSNGSEAWLSAEDLFANSQLGEPFPQQLNPGSPNSPIKTTPQIKRGFRFWRSVQDNNLTTTQNQSAKVVVTDTKNELAREQPTQKGEMEAQPDWIETPARTIGYETHPLEKVLIWLDNTMLRIEAVFGKLFHSLQAFWKRK